MKTFSFPKLTILPLVALALLAGTPNRAAADEHSTIFDDKQTKAIEAIVTDYLIANPQIIVRALQLMQEREAEADAEKARLALDQLRPELERDENSPVGGNPEGDVTIVEFFDYRCPYCKAVAPDVGRLLEADGNIRIVYKEWPILGPESVVAARATLAAREQGMYLEFHDAIMSMKQVTEARVMSTAEELGLDLEKLKVDMNAPAVEEHIGKTMALSQALGIQGTPAFVIGSELLRGAAPYEQLQGLVQSAREMNSE